MYTLCNGDFDGVVAPDFKQRSWRSACNLVDIQRFQIDSLELLLHVDLWLHILPGLEIDEMILIHFQVVFFFGEVVKKTDILRSGWLQGGEEGVSHLGPDCKQMLKFWPIFSIEVWFFDTQNIFYLIVRGLKNATPPLYHLMTEQQ